MVALQGAAVEAERVLEARAAAALDGDAQHGSLAVRLLGQQLRDLRGARSVSETSVIGRVVSSICGSS